MTPTKTNKQRPTNKEKQKREKHSKAAVSAASLIIGLAAMGIDDLARIIDQNLRAAESGFDSRVKDSYDHQRGVIAWK